MSQPSSEPFSVSAIQGATFTCVISVVQSDGVTPLNLTGFTAKLQIRQTYPSPAYVYEATDQTDLNLGGSTGVIAWTMSATSTAAIPVRGGTGYPPTQAYDYDLFVTSASGIATQVCFGNFNLAAAITHS